MLAQLTSIKSRLGITDATDDTLLTNFCNWVSTRFNEHCNRVLARTVGVTDEFPADVLEIPLRCYPVEAITAWHLKTTESEGWVAQTGVECLVRAACVVCLKAPPGDVTQVCRVTYTGGYVLPGTSPGAGQTALPYVIEQACIEQVAYLYQNRSRLGVTSMSAEGGSLQQFAQLDLLPSVKASLQGFRRERW